MWQRHWLSALALAGAGCLIGCGKSDNPSQSEAAPAANTPVQMNISANEQPLVLGADNIQAEIDKVGTGVKLAKLDLSSSGLALMMDAPEGATVRHDPGSDVQVLAGDHFALQIKLGKSRLDRKKQTLAGQKVLINSKNLLLCESAILLSLRCEFGQRLVVGHQDFCVENLDLQDGKLLNHSQADCLLMLKCAATLAPKTPFPTDPVAALQQLQAVAVKGANGQVTSLTLDLHQTTDATLALLPKVSGLERLNLHGCPITDDGLAHLGGLTSLKELNLSDCEFTDAGLSSLAGLTNLEALNVTSSFGNNPQIKGPGLAALAGMTKLQRLVLDKNLVDDAGLGHLKHLNALKELYLEQTRVVGPGLANLKDLSALTVLSLKFTKITDASLTNLTGLTGLQRLMLEGTEVSDAGLEHLQRMKGLKQVVLARTKVTKTGAEKLKTALPGVEIVME
jgi:hypothetical protein